jgi:hypothetical protein
MYVAFNKVWHANTSTFKGVDTRCNISHSGVVTQVAWNISTSNWPCNPNVFETIKLQQSLLKVEFASTFGNDYCNLC